MTIYLATNNAGKKREIMQMLPNHVVLTPSDIGLKFDPAETGNSFFENALIKAKALYDAVRGREGNKAVIADDSGLCVDALGGVPGIYSARYAGKDFPQGTLDGKKIPQVEQNSLLIEQLNTTIMEYSSNKERVTASRAAHYTCALVLYYDSDRYVCVQETMVGEIVDSMNCAKGTGGFGYDPIFLLPDLGKTAAELSSSEKNAISHRGKALHTLAKLLK